MDTCLSVDWVESEKDCWYFPVVDEEGKLKPAFLAVTNTQVERPEIIARNSERVLTARLRDARTARR